MPGQRPEAKSKSWVTKTMREIRSAGHLNLRRRRLHAVPIDRHHRTEEAA